MDKIITTFLISINLFSLPTSAQSNPQWGTLEKGAYTVGYKDTVVFKTDEKFKYYGYNEAKPVFISIWYPAIDNDTLPNMTYKNYWDFPRQENYGQLYDTLINSFHHIIMKDGVCIDKESNNLDPNEADRRLFQDILDTEVISKRDLDKVNGKFPCIYYHHGAQSQPADNSVFCEYMASHGYIVVSPNGDLPTEGYPNKLTSATDEKFDNVTDMAFVVGLIKELPNVDTTKMIAAGHSFGAQTEIQFDNKDTSKPFQIILSYHTTLEPFQISVAKKYWPTFRYLYKNKCKNSTTPVVLFAPWLLSVGEGDAPEPIIPPYSPFRTNKTTAYTFTTLKHDLAHDGFITLGNLRYPYCQKYQFADNDRIIKDQFYYEQIILHSQKIILSSLTEPTALIEATDNPYFVIELYNQSAVKK